MYKNITFEHNDCLLYFDNNKNPDDFDAVSIWRGTTWAARAFLFHFEGYTIVQELTPMCNQNTQRTKDFGNTTYYVPILLDRRL